MSRTLSQSVTTAQYADALGVNVDKVVRWIRSGQLRAINVAQQPDSQRPRWRIPLDAIERFEAARASETASACRHMRPHDHYADESRTGAADDPDLKLGRNKIRTLGPGPGTSPPGHHGQGQ